MSYYAGIDVSLEDSSICVVDGDGTIVREAKALSEPEALMGWFAEAGLPMKRIGLEAGPLSQWLHAAMVEGGLASELIETRHVRPSVQDDAGEDRQEGRARHRAVDAARLVPAGALQVVAGAGNPRGADGAQAPAEQAPRHRSERARDLARLRAQGRQDHTADLSIEVPAPRACARWSKGMPRSRRSRRRC